MHECTRKFSNVFNLLWTSLLVCGFMQCIILLLYFFNVSKCFYYLALQGENILVKNYAVVVHVNVTKYFMLFLSF